MRVRCVSNVESKKKINSDGLKTVSYDLGVGTEYVVYGMTFWGGSLDYLVLGDSGIPSLYPAELFKVVNHLVPLVCFFNFETYKNYKGENSQIATWGYREMINDSQHYIELMEGKQKAIDIFFKRKRKIDEYEDLCRCSCKKKVCNSSEMFQ